jgi:hypothetical protein
MESLTSIAARTTARYVMYIENELRSTCSGNLPRPAPAGKHLGYDKLPEQILSLVIIHFNKSDQYYHFNRSITSAHEHKVTLKAKKSIRLTTSDRIDYAELYTDWGGLIDRCVPELRAGINRLNFLRGSPIHNGILMTNFYIVVGSDNCNPPVIDEESLEESITYDDVFAFGPRERYIQYIERTSCIERRENFLLFDPFSVTIRRYQT